MLMFILAISLLTTSNLPWFMDLTFQVPMQYSSLQHQTLLLSPITSTTGCSFCFDSISSFFLELFLNRFPVAYWAPTDMGNYSFNVLSFCLFIVFMGFSKQEYWSGLRFPSPVGRIWTSGSLLVEWWLHGPGVANRELTDVQAGFRKGRGTRDQIANIHWIIKKTREFQKTIYFCFIDYAKAFHCVDHHKL